MSKLSPNSYGSTKAPGCQIVLERTNTAAGPACHSRGQDTCQGPRKEQHYMTANNNRLTDQHTHTHTRAHAFHLYCVGNMLQLTSKHEMLWSRPSGLLKTPGFSLRSTGQRKTTWLGSYLPLPTPQVAFHVPRVASKVSTITPPKRKHFQSHASLQTVQLLQGLTNPGFPGSFSLVLQSESKYCM